MRSLLNRIGSVIKGRVYFDSAEGSMNFDRLSGLPAWKSYTRIWVWRAAWWSREISWGIKRLLRAAKQHRQT